MQPRCPLADASCATDPPLYEVAPGRSSACHRWTEVTIG
nr:hypothetical protein [Actinomadura formosensis]